MSYWVCYTPAERGKKFSLPAAEHALRSNIFVVFQVCWVIGGLFCACAWGFRCLLVRVGVRQGCFCPRRGPCPLSLETPALGSVHTPIRQKAPWERFGCIPSFLVLRCLLLAVTGGGSTLCGILVSGLACAQCTVGTGEPPLAVRRPWERSCICAGSTTTALDE